MKQFYALTAMAVVLSFSAAAQFTQNFDAANSLTTGCNATVNSDRTTAPLEVINGTGSLFSNPPVNGAGTRDYSTPYLNVVNTADPMATTTDLSVSFNYKLNETLNGQAVRTIQIGIQGPSGYTNLGTITMDKDNDPVTSTPYSATFTVPTGPYRLVLKMGGSQGNGTVRIIIDDVVVSANPYYTLGGTCNTAPIARNDVYFTTTYSATNFTTVLSNDDDANGESLTAPVVTTASPDGTVTFNPDGSFTFTPNVGFAGATTSFTYTVYDNGFDPAAGTATVIINFGSPSTLPVRLLGFNGSLANGYAQLNWSVDENESGLLFNIEKSTDGRSFTKVGTVINTSRPGVAEYNFTDALAGGVAYYRLQMIHRDHYATYSQILTLGSVKGMRTTLQLMNNPVTSMLTFNYEAAKNTTADLNVYSISGAKVFSSQLQFTKGVNTISLDVSNKLLTGAYVMEVVNGTERNVVKFIRK